MTTNSLMLPAASSGDGAALTQAHVAHYDRPHGALLAEDDALERLYQSERWVPRGGRSRMVYPTPRELTAPFLEQLVPLNHHGVTLHVATSHPNSVQSASTETMHTAYGRVLIEARVGELNDADHWKSIGFVYSLDQKTPEVQVYSGYLAQACLNLAIFRKDAYLKADLLRGGEEAIYRMTKQFVDSFGDDEQRFVRQVDRLKEVVWGPDEIDRHIGRLYRHVVTKGSFGSSTLNYALKLLSDPNSRYAIGQDGRISAWGFYSALTQYVTDKAYLNVRAEKTLQITEQVVAELIGMPVSTN